MSWTLNSYKDKDIIDITNLILSDEEYCKKLLGIYLGSKSESTIDRYYEKFNELREKGHFDYNEKGSGIIWHWGAFMCGFLFFWYRKQYYAIPWVFILMFLWFFPSMILAGIMGYFTVLNGFALAVAKGAEKALMQNRDIIDNLRNSSDISEQLAVQILQVSSQGAEKECLKRGGVDMKPIYVLFIIACVFGVIFSY